jgi:AraC-like DNA-binding protein
MARPRAKADKPKVAALSDWGVQALHHPMPHGLKRAIEYIRGHVNGKMSIAGLVAHCGVPERTLRKHFRTFIAVSPLRFWRQLRLAAAHACLVEGSNDTSVTEVAARFGFGHFGRFARDYRQRFGETPSEALRRSHIESREREGRRRNQAPATPPSSTRDRPSIAVLPCRILRSIRIAEHSANTLPMASRQSCVECAPFP